MASLEDVVIVSAVRTPIGKFQGSLSDFTAPQLGAIVVREAVKRAGIDPNSVDECIMGNVVSAGLGQNPARQAALGGGLSDSVSAMTINKVCGSGLKAVALGQQAIQTGNSHDCGSRRHGEHDQRSLSAAERAQGISTGRSEGDRFHGARWPVGCLQRLPHGQHRRERRREVPHHSRGAGRVRAELASQGPQRHERVPLQRSDCAG